MPHTPKSPDFLVQAKEGHRLYLECVLATGRSQQEVSAQTRLNQALTALDRTSSPHHFLDLTVHGVPTAPISIKALALEQSEDDVRSDRYASDSDVEEMFNRFLHA